MQLPKGNRLTDWLERPLKSAQKEYAAADVERLLEIHDALVAQLDRLGRMAWAEEECEIMRSRDRGPRDPFEAWRKIKEARHLKGSALSIARSIAAWRERRAAEIDQPVRFVLSDIAVVSVAQSAPESPEALAKVRGVDKGVARGAIGEKILAAVAEGRANDWRPPRPQKRRDDGRDIRPAVALVAGKNQIARDSSIPPCSPLAPTSRRCPRARTLVAHGWRAETAGDRSPASSRAMLRCLEGGNVVLEERSRRLSSESGKPPRLMSGDHPAS